MYPPQSSSSQSRDVDYQFSPVIYDKEFDLRCSETAGVLGVGVGGPGGGGRCITVSGLR